ncbi:Mitochondrial inner membrane protease subunit 2, partial [Lemmus lemmus]
EIDDSPCFQFRHTGKFLSLVCLLIFFGIFATFQKECVSVGWMDAFGRTIGHKNRLVKVPPGHMWVEGDHHGHSFDSNSFGPNGVLNGNINTVSEQQRKEGESFIC